MRRMLTMGALVALFVGSIGAAAAVTGKSIPDLLTGRDASSAEAMRPFQGDLESRDHAVHDHASHDHSAHSHSTVEDVSGNGSALGKLASPPVSDTPAAQRLPDNDRARGLVFDGFRPGAQKGPCAGQLEMELPNGKVLCSHGPDPAPDNRDVTQPRSTAALVRAAQRLATSAADTAAAGSGVQCIGDGTSGTRVQAIYAVAADRTDRFAEVAPLIETWAAHMDDLVVASAADTGGVRHIRFVTDANCALDIERVVLSPTGDDNFSATISEMRNLGYNDPSRKYLVWMDANVYCGIAQVYNDDRPGADNYNNGRASMIARTDAGCWGYADSVELHELTHNLGGVQRSAPNATEGYHCTDEYDLMCYKDSSTVTMRYVCPQEKSGHLDCGKDDYFHTSPAAGSYLDTHWNTADSSFLTNNGGEPPPPPPNEPPTVDAGADQTVSLAAGADLSGVVDDDGLPDGTLVVSWTKVSGPGTVAFDPPDLASTHATFGAAGTYVLRFQASDGVASSDDTVTVTVEDSGEPPPPPPPPGDTTEVFEASLNKRFPTRTHDVTMGEGDVTALLTFSGKGRKAANVVLTIRVYDSLGNLVASAAGSSPVELQVQLPAGAYRFEISGTSRVSYRLEVTHAVP